MTLDTSLEDFLPDKIGDLIKFIFWLTDEADSN